MYSSPTRGMSLVDVVVGTAVTLAIFLALIGILRVSLALSAVAKAQVGATLRANTHMEYIRSLDYGVVGTVGGIPSGVIPQFSTTTDNGIQYVTRTFVTYVDSPKDGSGASDSNGITTDYKTAKVEVSYIIKDTEYEVEIVSTVVPPGIETSEGGGTLIVNVVTATGAPLPGATVHIVNASTSPTIDIITYSDTNGMVLLGGAPTSTEYQIFVSKDEYSSAETYARNLSNPNPTPGFGTVVEEQTTTLTFAIDELATLTLATYYPPKEAGHYDSFSNSSFISEFSSTTVSGTDLLLNETLDMYDLNGSAQSVAISPPELSLWVEASSTVSLPTGTDVLIYIVDGDGALIPDTDLPGNSSGFTSFPIDISGISTSSYSTLALKAVLSTSDVSVSPLVLDWGLSYMQNKIPAPSVPVSLLGTKTIGTTDVGANIYKTSVATSTDSNGLVQLLLEYDAYSLAISGVDIIDMCAPAPLSLAPNSEVLQELYIGSSTPHYLLVDVKDADGVSMEGVTVTVERTGFSQVLPTGVCGTAYFGDLSSASDYSITIEETGYTAVEYTNITINGQTYMHAEFE